jgi:hypothetical protein
MILMAPARLDLSRTEADALVETLNQHFEGDGMSFHAIRPLHWSVRMESPLEVETQPLAAVVGRNVAPFLPTGRDGRKLRRLMNETQMLLHDHPVNRLRESEGRPTVNSVWPWGGGRLPVVERRANEMGWDLIWSDDLFAQGLALASHTPYHGLPAHAGAVFASRHEGHHLVVLDLLRTPAAEGDGESWQHALTVLEERWFKPVAAALIKRRLSALTLLALDPQQSQRFFLTPAARWKFWRRSPPT